jgi:predicted nucleotidyltransferase
MPLPSKEENVLELFFNSPRHWHFEELLQESGLSRGRLNNWLHKFLTEGIIKRHKKKGKMPYYVGNFGHPAYTNRKRLYILTKFYKTGFLNHLQELPKAKTIILFGSMVRSDWYKDSDIDLFIYGSDEMLEQAKFERKLSREIQVFTAKNSCDLKKFKPALLTNIAQGYIVKGQLDFATVTVNA